MSLLDPVKHALSTILAAAHDGLSSIGAPPDSALVWVLGIASLVVLVRLALLPFVVHGVRQAHAAARARPHLKGIADRYRGRTDADSIRTQREERRTVSAEHGVSRLGCLPVLVQLPVWLALYHLVSEVASGMPVGAMGPELVSSFGAASVLGVSLAGRGYLGAGGAHLAVVAGLAVTARCWRTSTSATSSPPTPCSTGWRTHGHRAADDARPVGRRAARGRRRGARRAARLLGRQLDVDARSVGRDRPVVAHARDGGRTPEGLTGVLRPGRRGQRKKLTPSRTSDTPSSARGSHAGSRRTASGSASCSCEPARTPSRPRAFSTSSRMRVSAKSA